MKKLIERLKINRNILNALVLNNGFSFNNGDKIYIPKIFESSFINMYLDGNIYFSSLIEDDSIVLTRKGYDYSDDSPDIMILKIKNI